MSRLMVKNVIRQVDFRHPPETVLDWCRSTEARSCWPGVERIRREGLHLFYKVHMDLPGADPATLDVEEVLSEPNTTDSPGRVVVRDPALWTWPSGLAASTWCTYAVSAVGPGTTSLEFQLEYVLPGSLVEQVRNERRFSAAVEHLVEVYLACLRERAEQPALT